MNTQNQLEKLDNKSDAEMKDVNDWLKSIAIGLMNGNDFNIGDAMQQEVGTDKETVHITCTVEIYTEAWENEVVQNKIFWNCAVKNYSVLRTAGFLEKDCALAALGRAILIASKCYPATKILNGGLPLEVLFNANVPNSDTFFSIVEILKKNVETTYKTLGLYRAEVYANYARATINRMRFVHLQQDNTSQNQYYATLVNAVRAEVASENILKMENMVFRMIYHAVGFIFSYRRVRSLQLPDAIMIRLDQQPPGQTLVATTDAVLRIMLNSVLGATFPQAFRDLSVQLGVAANQILQNAPRFAKHHRLYGFTDHRVHIYMTVCTAIAPMLQGYLKTLSKSSQIARQQVIKKASNESETLVNHWNKVFEILEKNASTDIDILLGDLGTKIANFMMNNASGAMANVGNLEDVIAAQNQQMQQN